MKMKSVMKHQFGAIPKAQIPRSQFNRSHGYKTTFDSGYLVPFYVDEALPGDTFNLRVTTFARLSTPITPIMDNMFVDTFFFAVPYRLVWSHWEKFNGAQDNPGDSTSFTIPQCESANSTGYVVGSLQDYMGLPTGIENLYHNNLHPRAYNLIWNAWFRDQNLQNSVTVDTGDGPDSAANYVLLRRGKRHDYFTSCLPWPQKGAAVTVPIGGQAPIKGIGAGDHTMLGSQAVYETDGTNPTYTSSYALGGGAWDLYAQGQGSSGTTGKPNIYADLSQATSATINQLRQSYQIQKLLERDARGGTRYTEIIKSHFGVTSPDSRLQRPEYLGGGSHPISFNPVAQTSESATTPQGNLAAYAVAGSRGNGFVKSFTEHCLLIGLINVRADLSYQQGMQRMWSRQTRYDFYWPSLSHIGEQAVLNQEIYCVDPAGGGAAQNAGVFGYQERYAEYRYAPSLITGQFRSTYAQPLDIWHLAQKFTSLPTLASTFIQDNPPLSRVLAVGTGANGAQLYLDAYFSIKCARPMPTYSVPGLVDHF